MLPSFCVTDTEKGISKLQSQLLESDQALILERNLRKQLEKQLRGQTFNSAVNDNREAPYVFL